MCNGIATEFARLPNDLQREIYKTATYNPFKEARMVERWETGSAICEIRETPVTYNGDYYRIQTSWNTSTENNEVELYHIYIFRYTPNGILCLMTLLKDELKIFEWQLLSSIQDLVSAYKARKVKKT